MKLTREDIFNYLKQKFLELQGQEGSTILETGVLSTLLNLLSWILDKLARYTEFLFYNSFLTTTTSVSALFEKIKEYNYFPRYYQNSKGYGIIYPKDLFPKNYNEALEKNYYLYLFGNQIIPKYTKLTTKGYRFQYFLNKDCFLFKDRVFANFLFADRYEYDSSNFTDYTGLSDIKVSIFGDSATCYIKILKDDKYFSLLLQKLGSYSIYIFNSNFFEGYYEILSYEYISEVSFSGKVWIVLKINFKLGIEKSYINDETLFTNKSYGILGGLYTEISSGTVKNLKRFVTGVPNEILSIIDDYIVPESIECFYNNIKIKQFNYFIDEKNDYSYALQPDENYKSINLIFGDGVLSKLLPPNSEIHINYVTNYNENTDILEKYKEFTINFLELNDKNLTLYNYTYLTGFKLPESIQELKVNALNFVSKYFALLTKEQIETFYNKHPLVHRCKVYVVEEMDTLNNINKKILIIIIPSTKSKYLTSSQIIELLDYSKDYKVVSDTYFITTPIYVQIIFDIKVKITSEALIDNVRFNIINNLSSKLNFKESIPGKSYYNSYLVSEITNSDSNILYHDSDIRFRYLFFKSPFTTTPFDLPFLGRTALLLLTSFKIYIRFKKSYIWEPPILLLYYDDSTPGNITDYYFLTNLNVNHSLNLNTTSSSTNYFMNSTAKTLTYFSNLPNGKNFNTFFVLDLNYEPYGPTWFKLGDLIMNPSVNNPDGFILYCEFKFCKLSPTNQIILTKDALSSDESILFYVEEDSFYIEEII